jgi:hypothetical protein
MEFQKLLLMILAIVVLIILAAAFFFPQKGLLPKAANTTTSFTDIVNEAIGAKKTKAGNVEIPTNHVEAIKHLNDTIKKMKESSKEECIAYYKFGSGSDGGKNGLPELGEKGTSIIFSRESKGMRITVNGGADGIQEYSTELIEGVEPCVISGGDVPKGFHDKFFKNFQSVGYWRPVSNIVIKYDVGKKLGLSAFNENRISYGGDFIDFEDGGYIFKRKNLICFFPTNDQISCDGSSSDGLGDNCLGDGNEIAAVIRSRSLSC